MRGTKQLFLTASICSAVMQSCGYNSGAPAPSTQTSRNGDVTRSVVMPALSLAAASQWQAVLTWSREPIYLEKELTDVGGRIFIRTVSGDVPSAITDIRLRADMPEHGHGTGRFLPKLMADPGEAGALNFGNLYFNMTGLWRLRISATVDGRADVWITTVDVK